MEQKPAETRRVFHWGSQAPRGSVILLPGGDGNRRRAVAALRGLSERMQTIPILMMSGRKSMRDTSGQVAAFIDKPFEPREMLRVIQKLLM